MKCRATAFGLSFVILAAGLAHASVDYTVIEREASISRGKQIRSIESIANNGAAVGTILVSDSSRPGFLDPIRHVYWTSVGSAYVLLPLDSMNQLTYVWGINNVGGSCGTGYTNSGFARALYWSDYSQAPTALKPIGLVNSARGEAVCRALNDHGILVGYSTTASGAWHATKWIGQEAVDLGSLPGYSSDAWSISASGLIAGYVGPHAALWGNGTGFTDLGTLGGELSRAEGVNDSGQVVGYSDTVATAPGGEPVSHAFLWQAGTMTDLGALPDGFFSEAKRINRWGDVVGNADVYGADYPIHAVLWLNGSPIDLNQLLKGKIPSNVVLESADGIADSGRFEVSGIVTTPYKRVSYLILPHYSTNMRLSSSANPSVFGNNITFRASVRTDDAHGNPTGSVLFRDGSTTLKSVKLDSNGDAAYSTSSLSIGTHMIYALYSEQDMYDGNLATLNQRVLFRVIPVPPPAAGRPLPQ